MINSLRNFAKTKIAGIFIFIIIIPFVFWGMGSVFNTGNTNNIAKINNKSISTNDFMDYLNQSGIATEVIRDNLEKNIIEEILSRLISTTLLDLEIKELSMSLSNQSLIKSVFQYSILTKVTLFQISVSIPMTKKLYFQIFREKYSNPMMVIILSNIIIKLIN